VVAPGPPGNHHFHGLRGAGIWIWSFLFCPNCPPGAPGTRNGAARKRGTTKCIPDSCPARPIAQRPRPQLGEICSTQQSRIGLQAVLEQVSKPRFAGRKGQGTPVFASENNQNRKGQRRIRGIRICRRTQRRPAGAAKIRRRQGDPGRHNFAVPSMMQSGQKLSGCFGDSLKKKTFLRPRPSPLRVN